MKQGLPECIEFEYKRHGTLCLTPGFNILTGKIDYHTIAETRDENDFANHIKIRLPWLLMLPGYLFLNN